MIVRMLRATLIAGKSCEPGTLVEVSAELGRWLIARGKAQAAPAEVELPPVEQATLPAGEKRVKRAGGKRNGHLPG